MYSRRESSANSRIHSHIVIPQKVRAYHVLPLWPLNPFHFVNGGHLCRYAVPAPEIAAAAKAMAGATAAEVNGRCWQKTNGEDFQNIEKRARQH